MDIIEAYKFCPICGQANWQKEQHSMQCQNCGYKIYLNPCIGGVAVILDEQGRLLVVRRSKDPAKGTWHLPGGFVEVGETIEQAIEREVQEELNIKVRAEEYLFSIPNRYQYKGIERYPLDFFFRCKIVDMTELNIDLSENTDCAFLSPAEINIEEFGLPSIREGIRRYLKK